MGLRGYQRETIDKINASWNRGVQRPAAVLATGLGKTYIFAHLIREYLRDNADKRIVVLVHTDELVKQAAQEIKGVSPELPVGILKGARNDVWAPMIVVSVQSLRTEARRAQLRNVGMIIVDECHHAVGATYMNALTHLGAFDPHSGVKAIGFTATLARGDSKALNTVWQEVCAVYDILFGITHNDDGPCAAGNGYLLDVKGTRIEVPDLDLSTVKRSRGDFQDGDLGRAMTESLAPELVAKAFKQYGSDDTGMAFWPTVDAAYVGAEAMNGMGIATEVIHGKLKSDDRTAILKRAEVGETQVLSNCMVLTEGFNLPRARVGVLGRPTRSKPLYQQIAGRFLRPYENQTQALLLDVCGASQYNDLCCLVDLTDKPIILKDGQTLTEAVAEAEANLDVVPYRGPVAFEDFDPLRRIEDSKRKWMTTRGGTHFLAWGTKRYLFLVPSTQPGAAPGTWDVAWCVKSGAWPMPDGSHRFGGFTDYVGIDLGYAMKWAESLANDVPDTDSDFGRKGAPWRRRPASDKQIALARRHNCEVPAGATGDQVSTLIDTAIASERVDYYVGKIFEIAGKK